MHPVLRSAGAARRGNRRTGVGNCHFNWHQLAKVYAPATVATALRHVASALNRAVSNGYADSNPFKGARLPPTANRDRMFEVAPGMYRGILVACPAQEWRTLPALCRIGGVRRPSEIFPLSGKMSTGRKRRCLSTPPRQNTATARIVGSFPFSRPGAGT